MKRLLSLLLALSAVLLLTACTNPAGVPEVTAFTAPPTEGPKVVTTVDEFLAAIGPGAEIILAEGDFHLDTASDYGERKGPYYIWTDLGMGQYGLQIQYVENMTIRGAGKRKTNLIVDPRWADVLTFADCENITLADMTLGHTEMSQACEGGVVRLTDAEHITLEGLGLYGCGTTGVSAHDCEELLVKNCEIYECSLSGISLSQCDEVTVRDSSFHTLGQGENLPVQQIFGIWESEDVLITDCDISDNYVQNLAWITGAGDFVLRNNRFSDNRIASAAFNFFCEGVILDNNTFDGTSPRRWYETDSCFGYDRNGVPQLTEEAEAVPVTPGAATPVSTGEQNEVKVWNVEQFLDAISPDTCIVLETALLDLSKAKGYQAAEKFFEENWDYNVTYQEDGCEYYRWVNNYDGPSLVITGVNNLTIMARGEDRSAHTLSAVPRYADVLTFELCNAITLSGFTAGHTVEPGQCTGGVFRFDNSQQILVDNCGMYGCGTEGVNANQSHDIQVVNSEIYECSYTGIELTHCDNVAISGTIIRDIGDEWRPEGPFFTFYDSRNVTLDGEPLDGNYTGR